MRTLTKTLIALVPLTLFGGLAMAGGGPGGHHRGHGGPGGPFIHAVKSLDLSEAQQEQIDTILEEARADRPQRGERGADREAFMDELLSETPDAAALHAKADEKAAQHQQRMHDRIDDLVEISTILTVDQKAELADRLEEMKAEHEARRAERGDERGRRGPRFER